MRRRAGVGKLLRKKREREKAAAKGQQIEEQHLEHVEKVLSDFKEHLQGFASRHREDINKVRHHTLVRLLQNTWHSMGSLLCLGNVVCCGYGTVSLACLGFGCGLVVVV
mgnify:CR=1 FL=1